MTDRNDASDQGGRFISRRSVQDALRRAMTSNDPTAAWRMKRVSAAVSMLVAGRPGRDLRPPEPLVQVGFEPDDNEMSLLVADALERQRDLIHVSCHVDLSGTPTGLIAVVYHDQDGVHAHRRGGLLCAPGSSQVYLFGCSDVEDEFWQFALRPGRKMSRIAGPRVEDLGADLQRAGERWRDLVVADGLGDCRGEALHVYGLGGRTEAPD